MTLRLTGKSGTHPWQGDNRLYTVAAIWCEVISKLAADPPYPPEEPEEAEPEEGDEEEAS